MNKRPQSESAPSAQYAIDDQTEDPCHKVRPRQAQKAGYRTDLEMLEDYFQLIDLRKDPARGSSKGVKASPEEVSALAGKIEARLLKARPSSRGAYILGRFKTCKIGSEDRMLLAVLCYFKCKPGDNHGLSDAYELMCQGSRTGIIKLRSHLNNHSRLLKAGLLELHTDSSIFHRTDLISLSAKLREQLWGKDLDRVREKIEPSESRKRSGKKAVFASPVNIYNEISGTVVGQEEAKQALSVAIFNHYQRVNGKTSLQKANIILYGPTGCGKTFLAETVARILDVPFFAADATQYSETGYVGSDVEEMFRGLLKAARSDPGQAAKGVIYIDEIDKIAASRDNGKHNSTRDVSGESVQEELLRAVEGGDHPLRQFDAKNVLFIAGGAFSKMAPKTGQSDQTTAIGFGRCQNQALKAGKTFKPSQSDFVDYGMLPELMGRFQVRLALENLDKDSLRLILTEPKNSIISQYQYLFKANGITLKFEDRVLDIIAERAESMKTGARGLKSAVEEILNPLMFQHFGKGAEKRDLVISPAML